MQRCPKRPMSAALEAKSKGVLLAMTALGFVLATPLGAYAQTPRGGGPVIESIKPAPAPSAREPRLEIESPARPALKPKAGLKVKVLALRFTGNTVFSGPVLRSQAAGSIDDELDFAGLLAITDRITAFYHRHGYPVARAYLPAQRIEDGEVEITIIEGRYGEVRVDNRARLWDFATGAVEYVRPGDVVRERELERSLLLLNDMAGIEATATLKPGAATGATDFEVQLRDGPLVSGSLDADNFGSRYAGRYRGGIMLNLNNPSAIGDRLSLRAVSAGGPMAFGRLAYVAPINSSGTKLGLAYSHLGYELRQELKPLEIEGEARVASLSLTHPWVRSRAFNFYGQFGLDQKRIEESMLGTPTSRDALLVTSLGFAGDHRHGDDRATHYGVTLSFGNLDTNSDPAPSRVNLDRSFSKLVLDLGHLYRLAPAWSVSARLSGQLASTALVGAEQFTVGGPTGVRAYPQGEALGDSGYVAGFELRWNPRGPVRESLGSRSWGDLAQWTFFVEAGEAVVRDALPGQDRSRQLRGAGLGLNLGLADNFAVRMSYAHPIFDSNPTGEPQPNGRFWFQTVKWF